MAEALKGGYDLTRLPGDVVGVVRGAGEFGGEQMDFLESLLKQPVAEAGSQAGGAVEMGMNPGETVDALSSLVREKLKTPEGIGYLIGMAALGKGGPKELGGRQTVRNPLRNVKPRVYGSPEEVLASAEKKFIPENPLLKQVWGVTRDDLYELSLRKGNQPGVIPKGSKKPQVIEHAENVKTLENANRIKASIELLREKRPDMYRAFHAWYVNDPEFRRLVELVGPDQAAARYTRTNLLTAMESPGMNVPHEIARGTAANMMAEQGRMGEWFERGGMEAAIRGVPDLKTVPGRTDWKSIAKRQALVAAMIKDGTLTPELIGALAHKTGPYAHASGVPETGFQTDLFVGDAHKVRSMGLADTRPHSKMNPKRSITKPELQSLAPWHRQVMGDIGIEAIPGQAIEWNLYSGPTGVKSPVGPGKLELKAIQIAKTAERKGISLEEARDNVLLGKDYAGFIDKRLLMALALGGGGAAWMFGRGGKKAEEKASELKNRTEDALKRMGE